ncbi:cell envelope integrity protein TolA [Vibrio fluvialis]|nr:cell envelope integrity protein TolA [Vibrio fluvialis]
MVRWILAISILFPWVAHTNESIAEQQQAMGEIFSQMGVASEAQRWGAIYTQLISQNLSTNTLYKDQVCWINLRLQPTGHVRRVTILHPKYEEKYHTPNQELFCNEVFLVAFRLKQYPMPNQSEVVKRLMNINLTIRPL